MGFCALIGGGVTTLTFVAALDGAAGSSPGFNPSVPVTAQAGDLAVFYDHAGGGGPAFATPAGYTEITSSSAVGGDYIARSSYKVLDASEIGDPVVGIASGNIRRPLLAIFRPDEEISTVVAGSISQVGGTTDPADQIVLAAGQAGPLLVIGAQSYFNVNMASSPGFDGSVTESLSATPDTRMGWKIYNSAPADHTISATASGGVENILQSFYLRVS